MSKLSEEEIELKKYYGIMENFVKKYQIQGDIFK